MAAASVADPVTAWVAYATDCCQRGVLFWDILVPYLEADNMLARQFSYLSGAEGAGIVQGARVPIVLTSRAVITLVAHARRAGTFSGS
jgi:hypothetical protein